MREPFEEDLYEEEPPFEICPECGEVEEDCTCGKLERNNQWDRHNTSNNYEMPVG